ncbi:MAG: hypothetical protein AB1706_16105 [Pseudomonadota bacterium]|uniref:hypothetical protein n=1 Tax=Acinetobacter TaxID=469 RepID=UPI00300927FF
MAETQNISEMAKILSEEIFNYFRWNKSKPEDINWKCENDEHTKKTHPADVVFYYDDPYTNTRIYIHTDLKSFSESTLEKLDLDDVLESLSMQVECAEISEEWQKLFAEENIDYKIHGMLFIYNHDNNYTKSFTSKYKKVSRNIIKTPKSSRVYVLDPNDIFWLDNVATHMSKLLEKNVITSDYTFFYPQRKDQATIGNSKAATIDLIKSPFLIIEDKVKNTSIIFYRPDGSEVDEFVYLIDYLRHHQILESGNSIKIFQLDQDKFAPTNFVNAIKKCESILNIKDPNLLLLMNSIEHQKIKKYTSQFSEIEIGMGIR